MGGRDKFFSGGVQVQNGVVFNPLDFWGVGYAETKLKTGDRERLGEGFYNFQISEKLRLSLHLQHRSRRRPGRSRSDSSCLRSGCRRGSRLSSNVTENNDA